MKKLTHDFYEQNCIEVAEKLIGKTIFYKGVKGIITETEAYRGPDDEASHASKGPTSRSRIMFGQPGKSYVYMIYGMYHCLNIVAEKEGNPAAVLIRGLKILDIHYDGPGKLSRYLGITREHNGICLVASDDFYVADENLILPYDITTRIGINKAKDKLWRFVIKKGVFANEK